MTIKKILIVVPPLVKRKNSDLTYKYLDFETYRLVTPIDAVTMASDLVRRGFEATVFDLGTFRDDGISGLIEKLKTFLPDTVVVANSILTFGSTFDVDGEEIFQATNKVLNNCTTILTGTHASNYPGKAVKEGICDYSIKGEPDLAVGDLIQSLNQKKNSGESIRGLSFINTEGELMESHDSSLVQVDDLPMPDYKLIDKSQRESYFKFLEFGKIRYPEASPKYRDIMTSRGCIIDCSFCSVKHLRGGQKYRRKSFKMIIAEIENALEEGIKEIHFFDDLFVENEKQALEFAETLIKKNLKFPWFVAQGMPLWSMTEEGLTALKETGMYRLIAPFESGNDRVLKSVMGKLASVEHNQSVIEWARKLSMEIIGLFVIGLPGETRQDLLTTVEFAETNNDIDYSVFSIATPLVGTRMTQKAVKDGIYHDQGYLQKIVKRTVGLLKTSAFSELELGLIRTFEWDRINFSTLSRCQKYCEMVGMTMKDLDLSRQTSIEKFNYYFPDYQGPLSFKELLASENNAMQVAPNIN
jgi:anaerobic magnesium-protoporphyrin IX monomethyl ester cyclase